MHQRQSSLGTLREGKEKTQIRYEQSRWKIGTAADHTSEAGAAEGSSAFRNGSVSNGATNAASACHSFEEWEGTEAGGNGVRLLAGFAQHAGVAQCLKSQPVQQQLDFVTGVFEPAPAETVKTPGHARTNPSRRTTAIFTVRDVMSCIWSELTGQALRRLPDYKA
jgi:hypothetical protein